MKQYEQLDRIVAEYLDIIQTSQAVGIGISKPIFYVYVKEKNLKRATHGIYISEDAWPDSMYMLPLRCKQAVFLMKLHCSFTILLIVSQFSTP